MTFNGKHLHWIDYCTSYVYFLPMISHKLKKNSKTTPIGLKALSFAKASNVLCSPFSFMGLANILFFISCILFVKFLKDSLLISSMLESLGCLLYNFKKNLLQQSLSSSSVAIDAPSFVFSLVIEEWSSCSFMTTKTPLWQHGLSTTTSPLTSFACH